jgi:hypothetical protein
MKSAEEFLKALEHGLDAESALASLQQYEPTYCAAIPLEVFRLVQQLHLRVFPVFDFGPVRSNEATCDLDQMRCWARQRPNWALATGSASGVLALGVYGSVGRDSLLSLCGDDWDWLDTLRSSDDEKRSVFFRWPLGQRQICGKLQIGPGLRVFGEGDWVLVPPYRTANGVSSVYLDPRPSLIQVPAWLLDLVFEPKITLTSFPSASVPGVDPKIETGE